MQKERIVKGFSEGLELLGELPEAEDPEALGRAAALGIARPGLWEEQLGPLLTSAGVRELLGGVSREALAQRVKRGTVLALRDERGRVRYPLLQLDERSRTPYRELAPLIRLFRDRGLSGWELMAFLTTRQRELRGDPPLEWLREGRDPELVLALAGEAADVLSR